MNHESQRVTATGSLSKFVLPGAVYSISLTSGADAASAVLRYGGASGTILCSVAVPAAGTTVQLVWEMGIVHGGTLHVTVVTGTTPEVVVEAG